MTSQEKCDIHFSTGLGPQPSNSVGESFENVLMTGFVVLDDGFYW